MALKAAFSPAIARICSPALIGPFGAFEYWRKRLSLGGRIHPANREPDGASVPVLDYPRQGRLRIKPGAPSPESGFAALQALEAAVVLAQTGVLDAVVTAPLSKHGLHLTGVRFPGQTELLRHLTRSRHVGMMLVSDTLKVGLVTIHLPLRQVAGHVTRRNVESAASLLHASLRADFGVRHPRIAVLALNPHAGEEGDLGDEERRVIEPAVRSLRSRGLNLEGPFPADAFFGTGARGNYHAVLAMYHDQGLIPLKMGSFGGAVNFSAGLPIVRTSPDHGTAYDIAGSGRADPSSMRAAVRLACRIALRRKGSTRR